MRTSAICDVRFIFSAYQVMDAALSNPPVADARPSQRAGASSPAAM